MVPGGRSRLYFSYPPRTAEADLPVTPRYWGNNLGVRPPKLRLEQAGLKEGGLVGFVVEDGHLAIRPKKHPTPAAFLAQCNTSGPEH